MKRTLILRFYALGSFAIYLIFLLVYFIINAKLFPLWFSFACLLLSIYCFLRSLFFHLDSALWLGMFIFLTAQINILQFLEPINSSQIVALYFFAGAISSTSVAIIYKNFTFLKLSFILTLEVILLLLYSISIMNIGIYILCNFVLVFLLLISIVHHFRKLLINDKKKSC